MPNPALIPIFNQVQMDLANDQSPLTSLTPSGTVWLGELTPDEGEYLAGAILIGPFIGGDPIGSKKWESLELRGDGRASVIVWVDDRKVAQGMLTLRRTVKRKTSRIKPPRGNRTGCQFLALVMFTGKLLGCRVFWTPLPDQGRRR